MKTVKISGIPGALIMCLLSVVSCIREEISTCPKDASRLQFRFSYQDTRALQEGELKVANIYVFDRNDRFVAQQEIANPVIGAVYAADFKLDPGNYSFAVWVNRVDPYSIAPNPGEFPFMRPAKREAEMRLNLSEDRCVRSIIPTQLYGSLDFESIPDEGDRLLTIPLVENTNIINLTVRGLARTAHVYTCTITDDNGNYYFDNSFAPCGEFQYTTPAHFDSSDALKSSLTVLRLAETHHPKLALRDLTAGETVYPYHPWQTDDLIGMILKAYANGPRIDFDRTHVYDIIISFDTNMDVTVTINGWELTRDEQEL